MEEQKGERDVLHQAAKRDNIEIMEMLLNRWNINECPIHAAATNGQHKMVKLLIRRGANVNEFDVENGADINQCDGFGYTPLINATLRKSLEVAKYLVSQRADVNEYGYESDPLIVVAARGGSYDIISIILDTGTTVCNLSFVVACNSSLEVTPL